MKIINTDNFGSDYHNESFVAEGIKYADFTEAMCKDLNDKFGGDYAPRYFKVYAARYFKVVDDEYVLKVRV